MFEFQTPDGEHVTLADGCLTMAITGPIRSGGAITAVGLMAWSLLAVRSPTLTYHFAPLVVAIVLPLWSRKDGRQDLARAVRLGAVSFASVSAVAVVLWATDHMRGPTFWHSDGAILEALLFAAIGAVIGTRAASSKREGLLAKFVSV